MEHFNEPKQDLNVAPGIGENRDVIQMNRDEAVENVRKASYWFFAIAILSFINTFVASRGVVFIFGLALTQVVDGIIFELTGDTNYVISLIAPLLFIAIGFLCANLKRWAFIAGALIYLLDGILYLYFGGWIPAAVHCYILYRLYRGYQAITEYEEFDSKLN